jgi:tetratricopeptide (TPR) repeat protein
MREYEENFGPVFIHVAHGNPEPRENSTEMNEASKGVWGGIAVFALLVSIGFSWLLLPLRARPDSGREVWERPGLLSAVSRRPEFAIGFRNVLADVAWLEAVQVAGNLKMAPADYDRLYELLNVEANFDPKFDIPYLLGGLVLGESPDHAQKALEVFERGKGEYPADWRFLFYVGYTAYFSLGETETAGKAMAEAARLPGSPAYLPGLASRMLSEARDPGAALALLETIVRQENDPARRAVLERRIREVTVERDLQALERAVESYREKMGVVPRELSDLVRAGILPGIPEEPNGGRYLMEPGGTVRSDRVSQRLRVFQKK